MRHAAAAFFAAIFAGFASAAGAMEIDTAKGPVEIAQRPKRIAVFDIAAIDTLDGLGVEIAGVPDNLYIDALRHIGDGTETVGTLFEPDLEALSALAPDLVIVGGRSSAQLDSVSRVAPTVDMTLFGDELIAEARARVTTYGDLFGRQDKAAGLLAELDGALASAREAVAGKGKALILMTSGTKVTAYGVASRFGWLHRELDLPPAVEAIEVANHGEAISFEFIREVNPDWLIVLDRAAAIGSGEQNARATLDNELVAATIAWQKDQVVYLPAADFYIAAGGVASTIRVLDTITRAFSPS
ncbi:MAG: siderophore ABC transporter substrate-binding protein [Mesorhizobium sp.]|nr:siderophore ABC transporter substrate-binding protein [Mesorhizobium sp.]MBX9453274.1 siderophore ABC transporter substrate-binding protein [Mesorhizobium sp.]